MKEESMTQQDKQKALKAKLMTPQVHEHKVTITLMTNNIKQRWCKIKQDS